MEMCSLDTHSLMQPPLIYCNTNPLFCFCAPFTLPRCLHTRMNTTLYSTGCSFDNWIIKEVQSYITLVYVSQFFPIFLFSTEFNSNHPLNSPTASGKKITSPPPLYQSQNQTSEARTSSHGDCSHVKSHHVKWVLIGPGLSCSGEKSHYRLTQK